MLLILLSASLSQANAQNNNYEFPNRYWKLGIASLGSKLDNGLSPKDNVFDGRLGANSGFVLESGHIYYFGSRDKNLNYGLDWTIVSLTYNKLGKWDAYATAAGQSPSETIDGKKIAVSAATKIGPIVSFNPIEKLIIDAHFQVAPTWRLFDLDYLENSGSEEAGRGFSFKNYGQQNTDENFDTESAKNRIAFGLATNFGITVRRGVIGLSLDYVTGKSNISYDAFDGNGNETFGKNKIPVKSLQLKLALSF